jgi:hypothetical protein
MLQSDEEATRQRRMLTVRAMRSLARKQDGAAAVEFGMVAAPFLLLASRSWKPQSSSLPARRSRPRLRIPSRLIMTGQAQQKGFNQSAFKSAVCARIYRVVRLCQWRQSST